MEPLTIEPVAEEMTPHHLRRTPSNAQTYTGPGGKGPQEIWDFFIQLWTSTKVLAEIRQQFAVQGRMGGAEKQRPLAVEYTKQLTDVRDKLRPALPYLTQELAIEPSEERIKQGLHDGLAEEDHIREAKKEMRVFDKFIAHFSDSNKTELGREVYEELDEMFAAVLDPVKKAPMEPLEPLEIEGEEEEETKKEPRCCAACGLM